ncbi:hypothetical protein AgCh_020999 [Apium graveolens]
MNQVLARFREEYVTILGSNAKDLSPEAIYDAITDVYKAQLKTFHLFGKALEVKLTGHEYRIRKMNSVALRAIMGKLNIPLPYLPEQVRPEIPTPLLMPVNKTKGEIEARAAEGPSLSREFDELLTALKVSLNNNHFTYKKAPDKTINFIRVIMVNHEKFLDNRIVINVNDSGTDRCMQVSLNYLVSRRASELDIFINKVKFVTREDTMLLTKLRNAQVGAFPEAYLQPSKGITYICPTTKQFKHFHIPKHCVMRNKKLIMILETDLKAKKNKNNDDMEMIKLLRRYLDNAEANLPKTQINKDNLDDDEQKKDDQNPSGSNPSQSSKPSGSKGGENKKEDDKKDEERRRRDKSQENDNPTFSQTFTKIQVGKKPKKVKSAKKVEVTERAIWNYFKQSDFLPLNWCISDEDYFQQLVEEIVKVWIVSLREVRMFYEDGSFTFLSSKLMDSTP